MKLQDGGLPVCRMNPILMACLIAFVLMARPELAPAMSTLTDICPEQAQTLGISIWAQKNGDAGIEVRLEFRAKDKFKDFTRIELQIGEGANRKMSAPLLVSYLDHEKVSTRFSAFPSYLAESSLIIFVNDIPLGGTGYRLKVKNFVDLKKFQ